MPQLKMLPILFQQSHLLAQGADALVGRDELAGLAGGAAEGRKGAVHARVDAHSERRHLEQPRQAVGRQLRRLFRAAAVAMSASKARGRQGPAGGQELLR